MKITRRSYTKEEDDLIIQHLKTDTELAQLLNRTTKAISIRRRILKKQGLTRANNHPNELNHSFEVLRAQMITFTQAKVKIGDYIVSGTFTISSE